MVITTCSTSTNKPSDTPSQDTPHDDEDFLPPPAVPAVTPKTATITTAGTATTPSDELGEETVVLANFATDKFPSTPLTMSNAPLLHQK